MEINTEQIADLQSIRQALGVATMRKALNQDPQTVTALLNDMKATTSSIMEHSVTPYKGTNIDVRV